MISDRRINHRVTEKSENVAAEQSEKEELKEAASNIVSGFFCVSLCAL
jgi:hypothetical protein